MLALLYLISHIDRANIGNAKIEGLEASLNMTGTDYNVAVAIFFVPYILGEVPSNMLLVRFRPSWYIGFLVVTWGIVMTCTGLIQSFGGLCATRFLLGLFEAGFFPGMVCSARLSYQTNASRCHLLGGSMVPSSKDSNKNGHVLLLERSVRGILRSSGFWYCENGWAGRIRRLEVDLHPRRHSISRGWSSVLHCIARLTCEINPLA